MQTMSLEEFPVGEVVFLQGDIGNKFYIILQGSIDVRPTPTWARADNVPTMRPQCADNVPTSAHLAQQRAHI